VQAVSRNNVHQQMCKHSRMSSTWAAQDQWNPTCWILRCIKVKAVARSQSQQCPKHSGAYMYRGSEFGLSRTATHGAHQQSQAKVDEIINSVCISAGNTKLKSIATKACSTHMSTSLPTQKRYRCHSDISKGELRFRERSIIQGSPWSFSCCSLHIVSFIISLSCF